MIIYLVKQILSDGDAVWNLSIDGTEIDCVDYETAVNLGKLIEDGSVNTRFDPTYIERWS